MQTQQTTTTANRYQPMHVSSEMKDCIQNCLDCYQSCTQMIRHCLTLGGVHAAPDHISMLQSCATICSTSAQFMLLESSYHEEICGACARICASCAKECREIGKDDKTMLECAEICERCADSCREMSSKH